MEVAPTNFFPGTLGGAYLPAAGLLAIAPAFKQAQDARLLFRMGQKLTSETTFPQWQAGRGKNQPHAKEPPA